jgi:YD repeat-containing protein
LNRTTRYRYDTGRLTATGRPDGTTVTLSYDANGNMTVVANPAGYSHRYRYDAVDNNTSYTLPAAAGDYRYDYDLDRRLTRITYPSGRNVRNTYIQGRLRETGIYAADSETPEETIIPTWFCGGKLESIERGDESLAWEYDGTLVKAEHRRGVLNTDFTYTHDSDWRVESVTYADGAMTMSYNDDSQLTVWHIPAVRR